MSNNNDGYCCNPVDLENTEFDVCWASVRWEIMMNKFYLFISFRC